MEICIEKRLLLHALGSVQVSYSGSVQDIYVQE